MINDDQGEGHNDMHVYMSEERGLSIVRNENKITKI